jgi:hypothetical protein
MTDAELLAEMREQYEYATLEDHMLADGMLRRRCGICRVNPVPANAVCVMWCDPCVEECLAGGETLDAFVIRKRREARDEH